MALVKTGLSSGVAVDGPTMRERKPYRRRPQAEWARIRALYARGETARALAERFGGTERTIFTHLRAHGMLRRDQTVETCALDAARLDLEVRDGRGCAAEAPIRALGAGASLGEAAKASAQTAILMLTDAQPTRAYTYARLAGTLERLARGAAGDGPVDGTERGRQAALDFLRREGVSFE